MNGLSNFDLLNIWDKLHHDDKFYNACLLVSQILRKGNAKQYYNYSLEFLDSVIFHSRILTFGSYFQNYSKCPSCKEPLEWSFEFENLNLPEVKIPQQEEFSFTYNQSVVKYRLPNVNDVASRNVAKIIENCLISIDDSPKNLENVSNNLIGAIQKEMDATAQYSNVTFNLNCPLCLHTWIDPFFISAYFIDEINEYVKKLMFQVHTICSKYSWSEKEVLLMTDKKRNFYLELINS